MIQIYELVQIQKKNNINYIGLCISKKKKLPETASKQRIKRMQNRSCNQVKRMQNVLILAC